MKKVLLISYITYTERQNKINYEMELLLNKMREMNRKPQKYHPKSQKFFPHPSSLRFSSTSHKQYELDNANKYLKNRVKTAKGSYGSRESLQNYQKIQYYESQILRNSRYYNPFLNYVTPHTFEKKLAKYMLSENAKKEENYDTRNDKWNMRYSNTYGNNSRPCSKSKRSFDVSNCSSSINSRAFSALTRSSKKSITIERSIISVKDKSNKKEDKENNIETNAYKSTGALTKE